MHTYSKRFLRNFDFPLFFTYLFLMFIWSGYDL